MRSQRFLWFIIAIFSGLVAGLLAGWVIFPPQATAAEPDSLRADYQADVVLMTAEIYAHDGDLNAAATRLQWLGDEPPLTYVQRAILTGQELGFSQGDMQSLAALFTGLQTLMPTPQTVVP